MTCCATALYFNPGDFNTINTAPSFCIQISFSDQCREKDPNEKDNTIKGQYHGKI